MEEPGVSKQWSCATLTDGFQAVMAKSSTLDADALEREIQDS